MTPWQKAKQWHDSNVTDETFEETLGWHLSNGVVYAAPDAFMLAHPVYWDGEKINEGEANAWFIELASADTPDAFARFMRTAPRPLPYVLWCRHNSFEIKAHNWAKLAKKVRL
jgi:hypothetical protein